MNPDWIELLESLNVNQVEYIIVGAFALGHHGFPRYTGDLDIFASGSVGNAVWRANRRVEERFLYGARYDADLRGAAPKGRFIELDFGCRMGGCVERCSRGLPRVGASEVSQRKDSEKNKLSSGRPQDLVDVARLPDDSASK